MTFLSRRKRPTTHRAPIRCARKAISLAAGWLLAAGAASAQPNLPPLIQINEAPPARAEILPVPRQSGTAPRMQTVTFTRPPLSSMQATAALAAAQAGNRFKLTSESDAEGFTIHTELPGVFRLTERKSEEQVLDGWQLEAQTRPGAQRLFFPERAPVPRETYADRKFKNEHVVAAEPSFTVHRRLFFEQPNYERHGWDLGPLDPGISIARFYYDLAMLPYHSWTDPLQRWDASTGKCLPGDDTPLLWYRERFSVTGLAAETGAILLGVAAFP